MVGGVRYSRNWDLGMGHGGRDKMLKDLESRYGTRWGDKMLNWGLGTEHGGRDKMLTLGYASRSNIGLSLVESFYGV